MLENEKQNKDTSRKAKVEQSSEKAMNISNSGFYYEITGSSQEGYNPSGL